MENRRNRKTFNPRRMKKSSENWMRTWHEILNTKKAIKAARKEHEKQRLKEARKNMEEQI